MYSTLFRVPFFSTGPEKLFYQTEFDEIYIERRNRVSPDEPFFVFFI